MPTGVPVSPYRTGAAMLSHFLQTGGASSIDADIADYCSSWEKVLATSASNKTDEMQKQKAAYGERIRSLSKSQEAQKASRHRQQLHVSHEIMEVRSLGPAEVLM